MFWGLFAFIITPKILCSIKFLGELLNSGAKKDSQSQKIAWTAPSDFLHSSRGLPAHFGHGEVRVYRGMGVSCGMRRTTWDRSLKNWQLQILVLKSFSGEGTLWDSSLPVSLTLWDTPALSTPPLRLPQSLPEKKQGIWGKSYQKVRVRQNLCHTVSLWFLVCPQLM